jgi:phosphoribosyl 1,2-cyclic phosphate phosphodiesterase
VLHYRLPVFGFRIGDFSYITDANYIAPEELEKIKGSKVIILNALQKESHISHFALAQAVELLQELKPEKAFLTHISHRMGLHAQVEKELPDFIRIAYDGLKFDV